MRPTRSTLLGLGLLVALASPLTARAQDVYLSANAIGPRSVSFDMFYQELSPYGSWVQCDPYGWIWMPSGVDASWQPYTTGSWGYSAQYGYTWYADEVWGWAPFHYGNWIYTPSYGWAWVPGYSWSAAWVSWRYGAGYVAWAPLPPRYYGGYYGGYGYYNGGYGYYGHDHRGNGPQAPQPNVRNDVAQTIDPKHYVVVPEGNFQDTPVTSVMRRDVAGGANFNAVKPVDHLPTIARRNAPAGPGGGNQAISSRIDSPASRDIARVDNGDISAARALESSRTLESNQARELETNRVRDMGRADESRTALPRLAPTPRLPQVGSTNQTIPSRPTAIDQARPTYLPPSATYNQPRVGPTINQPRTMPSMPSSQPRFAPSQTRSMPMPRTNMPVMRATPNPRPAFRAAPSSGARVHMPSARPRR